MYTQKKLKQRVSHPTQEQVVAYAAMGNVAIRIDGYVVAINVYVDGTIEFIYG